MADGWVASDATKHSLTDKRPNWISLVSVAIAVRDISEFNNSYKNIIENKTNQHEIRCRYPVIKSEDIDRWCSDWERKEVRKDIVTELLKIPTIDNIQIVETSLHSEWVDVFTGEADKADRIKSEEFIKRHIQPYYNLISIWEYLRKSEKRPTTHRNVLTDDFSGRISPAWIQIGEMADELVVVPKGDQTYPLLSLADLLMELIKSTVKDWHEKQIYEKVESWTPDSSAYVDSDGIDGEEELELIAPYKTSTINTALHYPHPAIFIDTNGYGSSVVRSTDLFKHATKFAYENSGCVKFIDKNSDRDYIRAEDYIICLDGNKSKYDYLTDLNDRRTPTVMDSAEAKSFFNDEVGAQYSVE